MKKTIKTNEFLRAVHIPIATEGWVTQDLKEMGYVATMMIPVVKLGLTDGSIDDTGVIRNNQFQIQIHLTKEQAEILMTTLKIITKPKANE